MIKKQDWFLGLALGVFFLSACATSPKKEAPPWIVQPTRTVDNGYIVYVAKGEDSAVEKALFKAEAVAIQDISNECTFAPKGTRIEDTFDQVEGSKHRMYVKMGLAFEDCDTARKTLDPEGIRKLANASMTEELARYQELYETDAAPVLAKNGDPSSSDQVDSVSKPGPDPMPYYVMRQQLAYQKEVVIIAPANTYAANSVESQRFVNSLSGPTRAVQVYETQAPLVRSSALAWSTLPNRPVLRRPYALGNYARALGSRSMSFNHRGASPSRGEGRRGSYSPSMRRGRRR